MKHAIVGVVLAMCGNVAQATVYCIDSQQALEALTEQMTSGQAPSGELTVHFVAGSYQMNFLPLTANGGPLTVEGGFNADCSAKNVGAQRTTIQGDGTEKFSFHAFGAANVDLQVRDLTFASYPGAYIWPQGTNSSVELERVAFLFDPPPFAGLAALEMFPTDGQIRLRNLVIDANTGGCALHASNTQDMILDFVTVRNRGAGTAACLASFGGTPSATNSIFHSEAGADLQFTGDDAHRLVLRNSMAGEFIGDPISPMSMANLADVPLFETAASALLQNRIADLPVQTARDSGIGIAGVNTDILGQSRSVGVAPDRGAFELQADTAQRVFADGFEGG
jgi:hypothetical protein